MRRIFGGWAALVAARFFLAPNLLAREQFEETARIAAWPDGDTAVLRDGRRIRLMGVDTPEMARQNQPGGYFAREARDFVRRLTKDASIRIVFCEDEEKPGRRLRDRYGRLLGEFFLPDGRSLNEQLLYAGMAFYFPHADIPARAGERLLAAQKLALKNRAGCWQGVLARPEAQAVHIGNRKSRRFFSRACLVQARVAKRNQVRFSDLEAAFAAGYAPARPCGIWPLESAMPPTQSEPH